jgi:hypothetical protein
MRIVLAIALLLGLAGSARAQFFPEKLRYDPMGLPPPYDVITGRHLLHTADYDARFPGREDSGAHWPADALAMQQQLTAWKQGPPTDTMLGPAASLPTEPAAWQAAYQPIAWLIVYGQRRDPELYRTLGALFERGGPAPRRGAPSRQDLAWYAYQRAIELGHPAAALLRAHGQALEATWTARADAPTLEHYRFARDGADRWVTAYQLGEQAAIRSGEDPDQPAVRQRLIIDADVQVPETILAADSFLRRWGVGLLIAGGAAVFWTLFLVAIFHKRRKKTAPAA